MAIIQSNEGDQILIDCFQWRFGKDAIAELRKFHDEFRYQHGYGVVLLVASICARKDYTAIWCEHHEDFLAERNDGLFDAFQLKTRDTGAPWRLSDEGFYKSIKRFVGLDARAPGSIREFNFVSNEKAFETEDQKNLHLCPLKLLAAVSGVSAVDDLQGEDEKALKVLLDKTECDPGPLFLVLKRTAFIKSFPLNGFESLIAHEHLPQFEPCAQYAPSLLNRIVERLISIVCKASSLSNADPARHYAPLAAGQAIPTVIAAKRVSTLPLRKGVHLARTITDPTARCGAIFEFAHYELGCISPVGLNIALEIITDGGKSRFAQKVATSQNRALKTIQSSAWDIALFEMLIRMGVTRSFHSKKLFLPYFLSFDAPWHELLGSTKCAGMVINMETGRYHVFHPFILKLNEDKLLIPYMKSCGGRNRRPFQHAQVSRGR